MERPKADPVLQDYCHRHGRYSLRSPTVSLFASNVLNATKKGDHCKSRFIPSIGQVISLSTRDKPASIAMVGMASDQLTQIFRGFSEVVSPCKARHQSYTAVDEAPMWTLGHQRPLYVERLLECRNCITLKRVSGRWIPKDAAIPSIYRYTLSTLADYYGHYDEIIIAQLMDHWPPSSRRYRLRNNE